MMTCPAMKLSNSFLLQEDSIIKIQAFFRSNLARQDYKALSKLCVGTCCRIACQVFFLIGWHLRSCVCVCLCLLVCVCVCVRAHVCVCEHLYVLKLVSVLVCCEVELAVVQDDISDNLVDADIYIYMIDTDRL